MDKIDKQTQLTKIYCHLNLAVLVKVKSVDHSMAAS